MAINAKPSVGIDCAEMVWSFTATTQHNTLTEVSQGPKTAISAKARITRCAMTSARSVRLVVATPHIPGDHPCTSKTFVVAPVVRRSKLTEGTLDEVTLTSPKRTGYHTGALLRARPQASRYTTSQTQISLR